ncbi:hypothetical protein NKG05_08520 [Oerskovia sp. M15]
MRTLLVPPTCRAPARRSRLMGKHSQRHFAATLPGRSLRRRSPFAIAAALVTVAVTTTAGAASLATSPGSAEHVSSVAAGSTTVSSVAGVAATTPRSRLHSTPRAPSSSAPSSSRARPHRPHPGPARPAHHDPRPAA